MRPPRVRALREGLLQILLSPIREIHQVSRGVRSHTFAGLRERPVQVVLHKLIQAGKIQREPEIKKMSLRFSF